MIGRRRFLAGLTAGAVLRPRVARAAVADTITVTDVAGRTVTLTRPVRRIVLGEGRQIFPLALLDPDPVSRLAAWPGDLMRQDTVTYGQYRDRFPGLDAVPVVGHGTADSFSIEQALATGPDIAILSGGYGPSTDSTDIIRRFEAAGVPVVFIDFIAKPLENTLPSMTLLGRILGRESTAHAFADFYTARFERVRARLAEAKPKPPSVLMHAHAGLGECCNAPSHATIGAFVAAAGGHNIAADILKRPFGQLSLEYVIARDPEIYVGTGGIHLERTGGLVLGPGVAPKASQDRLIELAKRPGIAGTAAVRKRRVHGIWHLFNNNPVNVLAVEALARWFHPDLFADIDPEASLAELNARFLPVPMRGTYWTSLDAASAR